MAHSVKSNLVKDTRSRNIMSTLELNVGIFSKAR